MIRFLDRSRAKWRIQYIQQLRNQLDYLETDAGVTNTLCTAITQWFDTEQVTIKKYSKQYRRALTGFKLYGI